MQNRCRISQKLSPVALPAHVQDKTGELFRKVKLSFYRKASFMSQKLLTQFLRHLPTHYSEIEANSTIIPK